MAAPSPDPHLEDAFGISDKLGLCVRIDVINVESIGNTKIKVSIHSHILSLFCQWVDRPAKNLQ